MYTRQEGFNFVTWFIRTIYLIIELLLALRFILKLFAASNASEIVRWIYDTSSIIIHPFAGIFPSPVISGGFVFDITTLIAIVAYALIFEFIIYLFAVFNGRQCPVCDCSECK